MNEIVIDELNVKYGMIDYGPERTEALDSFKSILKTYKDIKQSYFLLGFRFNEFEMFGYYKDFGYSNMIDFVEANFHMDKSAYSRCLSVFNMICTRSNSNVKKMFIQDKYKNFSYSQLCEMTSMDSIDKDKITPDMSVRQIREIKKKHKEKNDTFQELNKLVDIAESGKVATSQQYEFKGTLKFLQTLFNEFLNKCSVVHPNDSYIKTIRKRRDNFGCIVFELLRYLDTIPDPGKHKKITLGGFVFDISFDENRKE